MAALFTVLLGVSASLLGYFLYDFGQKDFIKETQALINEEISHLLSQVDPESRPSIIAYIERRTTPSSLTFFHYEDVDGTRIAGNIHPLPPSMAPITEGLLRFSMPGEAQDYALAAKVHTFADGTRLMVARDIHAILESYEQFKHLGILIVFFMALVVLVSFVISHFVVSRINMIARTAQEIITTGDLSRRISIHTRWDDLSNLAQILNVFLEQIESLVHGIRDVSNNISHDLRTPLTRLRSQIETMRDSNDAQQHMDEVLAEIDHMLAIFSALLRIANIEQGKRHQAFSPVNISELLRDVVELYEPLAEEKQVALVFHPAPSITTEGDRNLLFQLFANLVDNALKFSPANTQVVVLASAENAKVVVSIRDHGPGIADHDKPSVFNRFYRADASRHTSGNGLGLALVKAIIDIHHGHITLKDAHPGLMVKVALQPYQQFSIE